MLLRCIPEHFLVHTILAGCNEALKLSRVFSECGMSTGSLTRWPTTGFVNPWLSMRLCGRKLEGCVMRIKKIV